MGHSKVTLSLPEQTLEAARGAAAAAGTPFSAYVARALRNETLRGQVVELVRNGQLDADADWAATVEADLDATRR